MTSDFDGFVVASLQLPCKCLGLAPLIVDDAQYFIKKPEDLRYRISITRQIFFLARRNTCMISHERIAALLLLSTEQ